jgi:ATP-dependent Clp protease ATP-binding subunit ClpB
MIKPALARGLQLASATTFEEYKIIERDAALARRFVPIQVAEPDVPTCITMLRGL